jgi:hypothetical protein
VQKKVVGPGVHFKWPVFQVFKVRETKDTTLDLEHQSIQLCDGLVYEVSARLVYQIVDLKKAMIEVDDLISGLKNRLTMTIQRVVQSQDRHTILDQATMVQEIRESLTPVALAWGFIIHEFGFSNFSPSPATLEITQLALLAEEKLKLYQNFCKEGLSEATSVSLISGAIITLKDLEPQWSPPQEKPTPPPLPVDILEELEDKPTHEEI